MFRRTQTTEFVPREVGGWQRAPEVRTFNRETIFDYIDGAGEVYRLYDFRTVDVFEFRKPPSEPVLVEVFDMGSAGDAYGIFTFYNEGKDVDVGRNGYLRPGLLCFWQDRYFVCVSIAPEGDTTDKVLLEFARAIAKAMPSTGSPPEWLRYFPADDRRPQSMRYFHNQQSLTYHFFLSEKNVLDLNDRTECALARYGSGEKSFVQVWVQYPDSSSAQAASRSVARQYLHVDTMRGPVKGEDSRWNTASARGRFVALAVGLPSKAVADSVRQAAEKILSEVAK